MDIEIIEEEEPALEKYAAIPSVVGVDAYMAIKQRRDGSYSLWKTPIPAAYLKDYDQNETGINLPLRARWDLTNWGFLSAYIDRKLVGAAVVAFDTGGVHMLEGRSDLAVLWDLRVMPDFGRGGVGTKLFSAVCNWSRKRDCRTLKIETQNTNIQACNFYQKNGCQLMKANPGVYSDNPQEIQLIWHKPLGDRKTPKRNI